LDWGGAAGTVYWLDPVEDIIVIGMTQLFASPWRLRDDLSVATYQSLTVTLE
jgi:CubicO group peptidase (beta-lactamase class C family)